MKIQGFEIQTIHHPVKAREIADANNATEEEGWKYETTPIGSNHAAVMVIDEENHIVGFI